jgi:recombinational DNA repair ATPase RecF
VKETRKLDSEMQTLVSENYNKFISATDTIRKMRSDFKKMEEEMECLVVSMGEITEFNDKINCSFKDKRKELSRLSDIDTLLKKLQFLFDLPSKLNEFITETFNKIFSEQHFLEIRLTSKIRDLNHEEVAKFIRSNREKEITRRITYYGVHRDDYVFHFDGFNSYEYCSLGQQKMAYLSLLFAYIELFRYKFNFYPIVLIDDVSGELDSVRWLKLIQYLEGCKFQTFITTKKNKKMINFSLKKEED